MKPLGLPKTGGRTRGTPNKRTFQLAEVMDELNFDPVRELIQLLPDLSDERRAAVCLELMSYLYPKRKPSDVPQDELTDTPNNSESEERSPEQERKLSEVKDLILMKIKQKIQTVDKSEIGLQNQSEFL